MKTTIAQQLKIKDFPFIIKDKDGNQIYYETSENHWSKFERDAHGHEIGQESDDGYWTKTERDAQGNMIRYENSNGKIIDNRPKQVEMTLQQIADKMGIKVEQLRIKD
jgi:RNA recognition motif-containing protein